MDILITALKQYPIVLAFLSGLVPALIWLWFWLKEDTHPEPAKMITLSFLGGMLAVLFVLPVQQFIFRFIPDPNTLSYILWAAIEEVSKFLLVYIIALRSKTLVDEPVDDMIYLIISALGFVTLENTLFLVSPFHSGDFIGAIITGNLRFVGASLMHVISSGVVGICLSLSFYGTWLKKVIYICIGLILAITLHTIFNLFIISELEGNMFFIFGLVWAGIVVLLLLFEKVKHITKPQI